jgi:hypothetical protein
VETEPRDPESPYQEEVALLASLVGAPEPTAKPRQEFRLEVQDSPAEKKRSR